MYLSKKPYKWGKLYPYKQMHRKPHFINKKHILDPVISEPRLTEKLVCLKVNLGFIIFWKKKLL